LLLMLLHQWLLLLLVMRTTNTATAAAVAVALARHMVDVVALNNNQFPHRRPTDHALDEVMSRVVLMMFTLEAKLC
jgi:hypothetical protein